MNEVIDFIQSHYTDFLAILGGIVSIATVIVKLTPTKRDDEILTKIVKILERFSLVNAKTNNNLSNINPKESWNKSFKLSERSEQILNTVDKRLGILVREVIKITPYDFAVIEGFRDLETQQKYFEKGSTKCDGVNNRSKHQDKLAIDIMCYDENNKGTWQHKYYIVVADIFKQKAKELNINIKWGGDFESIIDTPHFELT